MILHDDNDNEEDNDAFFISPPGNAVSSDTHPVALEGDMVRLSTFRHRSVTNASPARTRNSKRKWHAWLLKATERARPMVTNNLTVNQLNILPYTARSPHWIAKGATNPPQTGRQRGTVYTSKAFLHSPVDGRHRVEPLVARRGHARRRKKRVVVRWFSPVVPWCAGTGHLGRHPLRLADQRVQNACAALCPRKERQRQRGAAQKVFQRLQAAIGIRWGARGRQGEECYGRRPWIMLNVMSC